MNPISKERIAEINAAIAVTQAGANTAALFAPQIAGPVAIANLVASKAVPFILESYNYLVSLKPDKVSKEEWIQYLHEVNSIPEVDDAIDKELNKP